jgi:hypothetical protein
MARASSFPAVLALALAAPPAIAGSGLEYFLITPGCIVGMEHEGAVKACTDAAPELREQLSSAHRSWKARNAEGLRELSTYCQAGLASLYGELGIDAQGVARVRKAAESLLESMRRETNPPRAARAQCHDMGRMLAQHSITADEIAKTRAIPLTLAFMEHVDPEFLREPPPAVQANYQRARKLHFARSYGRFDTLRTGTASLGANCLGYAPETCERAHGAWIGASGKPAGRERLASGEEKVTYVGSKMLFAGTFADNHAAGLEQRVFVLGLDGRIKDAWDRVQLLQRAGKAHLPPSYAFSCERYGRAQTGACNVRSVDP